MKLMTIGSILNFCFCLFCLCDYYFLCYYDRQDPTNQVIQFLFKVVFACNKFSLPGIIISNHQVRDMIQSGIFMSFSRFIEVYLSFSSFFLNKRIYYYIKKIKQNQAKVKQLCFRIKFSNVFLLNKFKIFKQQEMQIQPSRSYDCSTHKQQKIMFICAVNQWHFEPLCQLCTPNHTQNHVKRLKINLQSFDEINKKITQKHVQVCQQYQAQIQKANQLLAKSINQDFPLIISLKSIQQKIINQTKTFFNQLYGKINLVLKKSLKENNQKLEQLITNLQNQIKCISQIKSIDLKFQEWKTSAKKIYFIDKLQSYIQESSQIIQQFQQKLSELYGSQKNKKSMFQDQNKFYTSLFSLINNELKLTTMFPAQNPFPVIKPNNLPTNSKKEVVKSQKQLLVKKPIIKQKSKTCKNCNQQMEYLTQNKKHLICKFCNMKERNYVPKKLY